MNLRAILSATMVLLVAATSLPAMAGSAPSGSDDASRYDGSYFGMSFGKGTYTLEGVTEADINIFDFRYGQMLNNRFGVEGRTGFGVNPGQRSQCTYIGGVISCQSQNVRIRNFLGVYARGYFMEPDTFRPYGVIGYSTSNIEIELNGNVNKRSDSSLSYGLGFEAGNDGIAFTLEYISLVDVDGSSIENLSAGFIMRW